MPTKKYLKSEMTDLTHLIRQKLQLRKSFLINEIYREKSNISTKIYREEKYLKITNQIKLIETQIGKLKKEKEELALKRNEYFDERHQEIHKDFESNQLNLDLNTINKLGSTFEERLIMAKIDGTLTEEAKKIIDEIDGTDPNREQIKLWKDNILKVVKDHKKNCPGKDCDISTFLLKPMAEAAGIRFTEKEFSEFM